VGVDFFEEDGRGGRQRCFGRSYEPGAEESK